MNPLPTDAFPQRLKSRLKMRHYELLLALYRHRSVSRVAEQLALSQPTVTRALADIEDIFAAPLFVRARRGLVPTPAGELVLARARAAVAEDLSLQQELRALHDGYQGRLRIGVIPYASDQVLGAVWRHLLGHTPRLAIQMHENTTHHLLRAVRERELDCAICRFSRDNSREGLVQEMLYRQQAHLVVASASAAGVARRAQLDIARLANMDWIFPPKDTPIRHAIEAIFAAGGHQVPTPLIETYSIRGIASALQQLPRGVTALPSDIARAVAQAGGATVLPEPLPWDLPPVGLAWLRNSAKAGAVARLAGAVRQTGEPAT
ncbi:MAG: LysR family transcriptional regulator [Proteobacteria bacterium]|nr:LysR family transcriptional regulator [Pseudomonadota bacterium]